jgi:vancomycin resistance protein VanW
MKRKLFCEISPFTYRLSMEKEILKRHVQDMLRKTLFARNRTEESLPVVVYRHNSLIRRRLGNVNMQLQENKATNLALAVKHIDGLIIRPGETFSVWKLIGRTSKRKGYKEGLTIAKGKPSQGIGGGLCQLSNLIHWLVLHSELSITEHHHHDGLDLFPDYGRQIPFGTGTSISYNYIDYRFRNDTRNTYQLRLWTDDEYLCGELRAMEQQPHTFHIHAENEYFSHENGVVYRNGEVYRDVIDRVSGQHLDRQLIRTNHARVMYDLPQQKKILFLHGFYASGNCVPALALKEAFKDKATVLTPDLPLHPDDAIRLIREICDREKPDILVGNSCGSFYAQMIAPIIGVPALLGNPHFKMSDFLRERIGSHQYKSPRADGKQDFTITEELVKEFEEIEAHQFFDERSGIAERDSCNIYKERVWGLFGEEDTLAHFEPLFLEHYLHSYHFPGGHTPTAEQFKTWYCPLIEKMLQEYPVNDREQAL